MGLTKPRAYQIFDIDYKQSVRVVTVSNVTLSGGAPSQVDGVTLSLNDRVLVTGQSTGSQNGLYYVTTVGSGSNGTWARSVDGNETGEIEAGMIVMVTEGTTYADTQWKLTTNDPITIGSTALTFVLNVQANSISSGSSNVVVNANANVTVSSAGTSNVAVFSSAGANITGTLGVSGNVTVGNITATIGNFTTFNSSQGGNVTGTLIATSSNAQFFNQTNGAGYVTVAGYLTTVGNITGGNIISNAVVIATGNITGGNLITAGQVVATGNITGGNVLGGALFATTTTANAVTARLTTGNDNNFKITAQNGVASNTTGTEVSRLGMNYVGTGWDSFTQYIRGSAAQNGSQVLWASNTAIANISSTGLAVTGVITATGNITGGNLSGTSIVGTLTTAAQTNITSVGTLGSLTVTANVAGGNLTTAGQISATGTITSTGSTNSTAFAVGNSAVSNVALGFFPTAGTRGDYAIRDYSTVASTIYFDVGMGGSAAGDFKFRTTNSFSSIMTANTAGITTPGTVYGLELSSTQSNGDEGGQVNLAKPATNSTLAGGVIIDVYQNKLRFFENGGTARGAYIDITAASAGVGTNLLAGGGGGTPGGSNTYVQFNDASTFGGNSQFTYDKVTNTLTAGIISSTNNGNGTNFRVGDDAYLGDINTADTISLRGLQNAANGYIVFGNADTTGKLGRAGSGPLTYAGAFTATGNITGGNANIAGQILVGSGNAAAPGIAFSADITQDSGFYLISDGNIGLTTNGTLRVTFDNSGGITATGNITGGNINTAGRLVSSVATGTAPMIITSTTKVANLNVELVDDFHAAQAGTVSTIVVRDASGYANVAGLINSGANGVGNIGSSSLYFNTVFAKATSAQYADLAEMYVADADYSPGTVVEFGGEFEITITTEHTSSRVAGIISTNPSYLMNSAQPGEHVLPVALTGRVPCRVQGPVRKGDVLVSSNIPGVAQRIGVNWQPGCTVGKAMESINDTDVKIIEVAVGRL